MGPKRCRTWQAGRQARIAFPPAPRAQATAPALRPGQGKQPLTRPPCARSCPPSTHQCTCTCGGGDTEATGGNGRSAARAGVSNASAVPSTYNRAGLARPHLGSRSPRCLPQNQPSKPRTHLVEPQSDQSTATTLLDLKNLPLRGGERRTESCMCQERPTHLQALLMGRRTGQRDVQAELRIRAAEHSPGRAGERRRAGGHSRHNVLAQVVGGHGQVACGGTEHSSR